MDDRLDGIYGQEEGAPEDAPQKAMVAPQDPQTRRAFLATLGVGAGAATSYVYGRPDGGDAEAAGKLEIAADDPLFPEEQNLITNVEDSTAMLAFAEEVAAQIESGAIELTAEQRQAAILASGGVALSSPERGGDAEPVADTRMTRRGLVGALMGGTLLLTGAQFAQAKDKGITFVAYNYNSNARADGKLSGDELRRLERTKWRNVSLEEFTRMNACESPRGARLFAYHEEVLRYNREVERRRRAGYRNPGTPKESPIVVFDGWYRKPSNRKGSNIKYSFFRLKDQVLVRGKDGQRRRVYKHYGVGQYPGMITRKPHYLLWSGYLGTDRQAAERGMIGMLRKV